MSTASEINPTAPGESHRVVIVGGSAAGLSTATALRRQGYVGHIDIVEGEQVDPYERPPLSKDVLSTDWKGSVAPLLSTSRMESIAAQFVYGDQAIALDAGARVVHLHSGRSLEYDDLVIASGLTPRRLPGTEIDGVHVLRTLSDALRLREDLQACRNFAIVGGGFLGLEAAASVRAWLGIPVTVLEPMPGTLGMRIGEHAAEGLLGMHERAGIRFLQAGVRDFVVDPAASRVTRLEFVDGGALDADCVLLSIGAAPTVGWLENSGLDLADGVVCDEFCRAAPSVWAVGDVCRWYHRGLGQSTRLEHRTNASEQGLAVAQNILGGLVPYMPVPYFWTDQGDVRVQVAGVITPEAVVERVLTGSGSDSFVELHRVGTAVVGVVGWNAGRAFAEQRRNIRFAETDDAVPAGSHLN